MSSFVGNTWDICDDGVGQVGCGKQETFRNCADVAIITNTGGFGPVGLVPAAPTTLNDNIYAIKIMKTNSTTNSNEEQALVVRLVSGEILQKMLRVIFYVIIIRFLGLKSVLLKENTGIRTLMPGVWPTASSTHQLAPTIIANACKFISKIFLRLYLNLH